MESIALTVAIPTYNGGTPLIEAVESCIYIDLDDDEFEVLIVNNCSNDGSIEIIQEQFADFKPIRIVENDKNYGRIGNWNRCIEFARGEFMLFLFVNDLLDKDNHIAEVVSLIKQRKDCSLVNMPWVISNYKMTEMSSPTQFFTRTPGYGFFDCNNHIKTVVERGKLPFVPLQSNIVRKSVIIDQKIQFDSNLPITSDGVFLTQVATGTGIVGFYEKPSIIWRHDAPNRLHGHVKLDEHNKQIIESFAVINRLIGNNINLAKAFAKSKGLEYITSSIIRVKSKHDANVTKQFIINWWQSLRKYNINKTEFAVRSFWEIIKWPFKIKTLIKLFTNRN